MFLVKISRVFLLEIGDHLGDGKDADRKHREADTVRKLRQAEGVAFDTGIHIGPDEADQQSERHHCQRLDHVAMGEDGGGYEPEHHQGEIILGAEAQGPAGERHAQCDDQQGSDAAGDEGRNGGDGKGGTGAALAGHLVAVEAGHGR